MASTKTLTDALHEAFPSATIPAEGELEIGSFPEWDSLGHFNFMMLIEQEYGVRFSVAEMNECKSLRALAALLAKQGVTVSTR